MTFQAAYQAKFNEHKICVLVPTYNNNSTLGKVLDGILDVTTNIVVVNDGSTDSTSKILAGYRDINIVQYTNNRGKGWALRKGFERALELGYHYAITIDSDGQHFPFDLPKFIDKLEQTGPCLIIGARNMEQSSVPGKSSFGHKFSNFWFWVETGITAPDTQSGFRLYPIKLLEDTRYFTKKFEFEIEVIVRAAWKGIPIETVPVSVFYAPPGERVTHFRPFTDFTRISILNTLLVFITIFYINPVKFVKSIFRKSTWTNLRQELFNRDEPVLLTSFSVAFGIFMGIVPIWGFQMLVAIAISVMLRLNKAMVLVCANISIPPMIPIIIYLSYKMGAVWVGESSVPLSLNNEITLDSIHENFIQYVYGSITLAVIAGALGGMTAWLILTFRNEKKVPVNE